MSDGQSGCCADKVHYVNGPGEVLHAFDAEAAEELSVYAGEEVRLSSRPSQAFIMHLSHRPKGFSAGFS